MDAPSRNLQNKIFRRQIRSQCEQVRRMHPSGASGIIFEAVPGPVQFKVRTPDALLSTLAGGQAPNAWYLKLTLDENSSFGQRV
eukprot:15286602-Alexandrium_andersonii.AAC.1